jgi:competence protein ComEC
MAQPALVEDASFQLSFASTFGILWGWSAVGQPKGRVGAWILAPAGTSLFAWIALLPLCAAHFNQISLAAPLANLVLVPFSGILLAAGVAHLSFFEWLTPLQGAARAILEALSNAFLWTAEKFADMPWASAPAAAWGPAEMASWVLALGALGLWAWRPRLGRACLVLSSAALAWTLAKGAFPARVEAAVLSHEGETVGIFARKGWRKALCYSEDPAGAIKTGLAEFAKRQGLPGPENACLGARSLPLKISPRMAFEPGPRFKLPCGSRILHFPLSLYGETPGAFAIHTFQCPTPLSGPFL